MEPVRSSKRRPRLKDAVRNFSPKKLILLILGLVYLVSPIDLIPDFLPGGWLDDGAVLLALVRLVLKELDRIRKSG